MFGNYICLYVAIYNAHLCLYWGLFSAVRQTSSHTGAKALFLDQTLHL